LKLPRSATLASSRDRAIRFAIVKVFISWSGDKSRAVALALRVWLPQLINAVEPFVSTTDIESGARWQGEISERLEESNFGIVCVTGDNQAAPWLNFEAGALAKQVGRSRVVPLAVDLELNDIRNPLAQFQAHAMDKDGINQLLHTLNRHCDQGRDQAQLDDAYDVWWPRLEPKLEEIRLMPGETAPRREDRELLEEILSTIRVLARRTDAAPSSAFSPREIKRLNDRVGKFLSKHGDTVPDWRIDESPTGGVLVTLYATDEATEEHLRDVSGAIEGLGIGIDVIVITLADKGSVRRLLTIDSLPTPAGDLSRLPLYTIPPEGGHSAPNQDDPEPPAT
jgi:hypothetical protein